MRTLCFSSHAFDRPYLEQAFSRVGLAIDFTHEKLRFENASLAQGYEALALFTSDQASAEVIKVLSGLGIKHLALRSAGYDHVDLTATRLHKIKVAHAPDYSSYSIAEHAIALFMALNRKLIKAHQLIQNNDFRLDDLVGFDLHGKTVCVVGTGKIGTALCRILNGFGCSIKATDPNPNLALTTTLQLEYTSLPEAVAQSRVTFITCPLTPQTYHMFDKNILYKMPADSYLINVARGGIVHTKDLIDVLQQGHLSGAGLDVYEHEKNFFFEDKRVEGIKDELFDRLRSLPNVLITGHQAFLTKDALERIAFLTAQSVYEWSRGLKPQNEL